MIWKEMSARIRLAVVASGLAALYYALLVFVVGWAMATHWPGWWIGIFPNRLAAGVAWLITLHATTILSASLPVALASVAVARDKALQLGAVAGVLATVAAIVPSLSRDIWPLVWSSHPVFFVTDQVEVVLAVPFVAWVILMASSNKPLQRARVRPDAPPDEIGNLVGPTERRAVEGAAG
jgi:hypothetical protein